MPSRGLDLRFELLDTPLLGLIGADVERLLDQPGLRIPHMGWNRVDSRREDPLIDVEPDADDGEDATPKHRDEAPLAGEAEPEQAEAGARERERHQHQLAVFNEPVYIRTDTCSIFVLNIIAHSTPFVLGTSVPVIFIASATA